MAFDWGRVAARTRSKVFVFMENWKDVVGYETRYEVSDKGQIRNKKTGNIFKPSIKNSGYYKVIFYESDKANSTHNIHRLVATAFLDNYENKACVNHKDGNKLNNDVNNLEWVSYSENLSHAYKTNLVENPWRKKVVNTNTGEIFIRTEDAAKSINKPKQWLIDRLNGRTLNNTSFKYV